MSTEPREVFLEAVLACDSLPEAVRAFATKVRGCETSSFDESYIEFLDLQIALNARGDEWSEILRRRRVALSNYCRLPLVRGNVHTGDSHVMIYVDPRHRNVVYWEAYSAGGVE